jgi:nucleoside-diphosphate-sugar epimerase
MVAKVIAEKTALKYSEKNGLNVVTVCPMALGPLLRPMVNVSHEFLLYIIKGCIIFVDIFCYFLLVIRICRCGTHRVHPTS